MGNVWTVARHTIAESIRMKLAVFLVVLLAVLLLGLPFASKGDNPVSGAVQSFLAYSVAALSVLLSCLAIFLSKSLSNDLAGKQILTLMTKPLGRWQYVIGKWLGIVLLNVAILTISGFVIYGMTCYIASQPARDEFDRERLEKQILQARHASRYVVPDFTVAASAMYERYLEEGRYRDVVNLNSAKEKERLRGEEEKRWRSIWPLESRVLGFEDVRCPRTPEETVHIRYTYRVHNFPPDEILRCRWIVGNPQKDTQVYEFWRRDVIDRVHTVAVPADAVAADNTLTAVFINANPWAASGEETQRANTVVFQGPDSVEVLFSVSSFGSNLARALCLVMCRVSFLAAVAVTATTVFSFPVACLVALTIYILAATRGFIGTSMDWFMVSGAATATATAGDLIRTLTNVFYGLFRIVIRPVLNILLFVVLFILIPDFAKFDGLENLVDGRNVTLKWVLLGVGRLVLIQTSVLLLIACLLFRRREVSEVSL